MSVQPASFGLFDHVKFTNHATEETPKSLTRFEAVDALFSFTGKTHHVILSTGRALGSGEAVTTFNVHTRESNMGWCKLAMKITLWVLAIITVLPAIAILIIKAMHHHEVSQVMTDGSRAMDFYPQEEEI